MGERCSAVGRRFGVPKELREKRGAPAVKSWVVFPLGTPLPSRSFCLAVTLKLKSRGIAVGETGNCVRWDGVWWRWS